MSLEQIRAELKIYESLAQEVGPLNYEKNHECPQCDAIAVKFVNKEVEMTYGESNIEVTEPIGYCYACGIEFTDWRGEWARTKAIAKLLEDRENV